MAKPRAIVRRDHKKGCRAIWHCSDDAVREGFGRWSTPWGVPRLAFRDSLGRERHDRFRGHTVWLEVGCNCTDCDALLLVEWTPILEECPHSKPPTPAEEK